MHVAMECDMTKGSPLRLLLTFTIPLFIGNVFQQLYSMVDTIVVGRFVGVDALAAVGSTSGFSFMVVGFAQGLTAGFAVIVSQSYGARDMKMMRKSYAMGILCSALWSVVIAVLFYIFSEALLRLIDTPENIIKEANAYISIIYAGIGTAIFYNLFSSILRAVGDGRSPVYFLLLSSVLNIGLDLFFVIVIPLGCAGVAIATIIAQGISALVSLVYIRKRFPIFRFEKGDWKLDIPLCIRLTKIGIPGAVQFSVCALGVIIVQAAINGFGSDTVAAYSVGGKIENLVTQFFPALGMGISTFASQNLGAGDTARIRKGFRISFLIMCIGAFITFAIAYIFADKFSLIFMDSNSTSPEIISMAVQYVRTVAWFFIPLGMIFIYRTGSQGLGSGTIPLISSIAELVMRAIAAFTLPLALGYTGICFASPVAWCGAGFLIPFCYLYKMKKIEKGLALRRNINAIPS